MTSPTSRFGSKKGSSEIVQSSPLAKVYLRNFGKGLLEFSDTSLKFYVEKGRFSKSKELAKEIPLTAVESVSLEEKELVVNWNDSASRFVFEDASLAQQVFTQANGSLSIKPREEPQSQPLAEEQQTLVNQQPAEVEATEEVDRLAEELEPDLPPAPVQSEEPPQQTLELPPEEPAPEAQKPEKPLPVEPQTQEIPEKQEFSRDFEQIAAQVEIVAAPKEPEVKVIDEPVPEPEAPKEPEADVAEKPVAEPEVPHEPTQDKVAEVAVQEAKAELEVPVELPPAVIEAPKPAPILPTKKVLAAAEVPKINKAQEDLDQTVSVWLSVVDSLFDVLRCMQGRVNWGSMHDFAKRAELDCEKLAITGIVESDLDFCFLSSAIVERNVDAISKEALKLLDSVYQGFHKLAFEATPVLDDAPNYAGAGFAVESYFVLSDLVLAAAVGDADVEEEMRQFNLLLAELSKAGSSFANVAEMVTDVHKVQQSRGKDSDVERLRQVFRKQLKLPP